MLRIPLMHKFVGRVSLLPLGLFAVGLAWGQQSHYSTIKRPRVLVHTGCGSQPAEFPRRALSRVLTKLNMPAVYIEDLNLLTPENLSHFDIFINSGSVDGITAAQEKAVYDFVQHGGGFLALHNSSAGDIPGGLWEKLIGGRFQKHPPPYLIKIHVTAAGRKSPITKGVEDFEVVDEQHFVSYFVDGPPPPGIGPPGPLESAFWTSAPHVLIESESVDNTVDPELPRYAKYAKNGVTALIGGWWQIEGKGRMVFFAPGHMAEVMNNPMMQKLYYNALEWLARED